MRSADLIFWFRTAPFEPAFISDAERKDEEPHDTIFACTKSQRNAKTGI